MTAATRRAKWHCRLTSHRYVVWTQYAPGRYVGWCTHCQRQVLP